MINTQEFKLLKEGSIVEVRGNFGSGPSELATIECVEDDIKNGTPGIDYRTVRDRKSTRLNSSH